MADVRFKSFFYSQTNDKYEVKILDTELVGSTNYDVNWGDDTGVSIRRKGGTPLKPSRIVGTSAELVLQIINSDDQAFYDELVVSYEGRFFMEVNWFLPTSGFINIFKGQILPDISAVEDKFQPIFSISAVDGLEDLKNIPYYGDPVPNLQKSIAEHVGRVLNALAINTLYDSFQNFYKFAVDLRDENHAVAAIFARDTRVRNYFYEKKDGIKVFSSMYDVLHEFLSMINARIYFSEGVFIIEQLGYRGEYEILTYDVFNADRTYDSSESSQGEIVYLTEDNLDSDANPTIKSIAPVQDVTIIQAGENLANLLLGKEWDTDESSAEIITSISEINGVDRLFFTFDLYHYIISSRPTTLINTTVRPVGWIQLEITISIDDGVNVYYYGGIWYGIFYNNQQAYEIPINAADKSTTPSVITIRIPISRLPPANTNIKPDLDKIPVYISTPSFTNLGDITIDVNLEGVYNNYPCDDPFIINPAYAVSPEVTEVIWWEAVNPVFAIGSSLEEAIVKGDRVTTLLNDIRNNIKITEKFSMGVYPNTSSYQKLEIYDGAAWVDSTGWKNTTDTTYQRLAVQVIRDIFKQRTLPSSKIEISMWDKMTLYNSYERLINYKGKKCIWLDWDMTTQDNTIRGTLWELINGTVADDPTPTTTDIPTEILGLPPGFTTNTDPPVSDVNGETDYVEGDFGDFYYYEAVMSGDSQAVSNYDIFPDSDYYTMLSINNSIKINIGSALYHIVDKLQVNLSNYECRLDFATKTVEFKSDQTGRLFRFDASNKYNIKATI